MRGCARTILMPREKLRLRVLHLAGAARRADSLPVSDALLNLGWFYANMARYEEAQAGARSLPGYPQRLLGPDAAPVAEVLNALGALEENRSNLDAGGGLLSAGHRDPGKGARPAKRGHREYVEQSRHALLDHGRLRLRAKALHPGAGGAGEDARARTAPSWPRR